MQPLLRLSPLLLATLFTGCASVMNDASQPMRIETKTADGQLVAGAECKVGNNHGTQTVRSGDTAAVRRSGDDLDIACSHPGKPPAQGRAVSRANAGFAGNVLLGGGIGMIVDHKKGTAYSYPGWVQLVFGKSMVFDRSAERDGLPVPGMETGTTVGAAPPPSGR